MTHTPKKNQNFFLFKQTCLCVVCNFQQIILRKDGCSWWFFRRRSRGVVTTVSEAFEQRRRRKWSERFSSSSLLRLREQQQQLEEVEDKEFGGGEFTKSNEEERRNSAADSSSSSSSSSDTNTNNKILRLIAHDREKAGRLSANRARKDGFIPCAVFKQGEIEKTSEVCAVSEREVEKLLRKFTKYGLRTKLIDIVLDDGKRTVKAIPQQIQMHAYKNQVNNITFMRVDPETIVKVPIPVKVTGQDDCPGTKLGAFVSHTRKTIKVKCRSDQIPEAFFVDVSNMNVKDNVKIANLDIPEGVVICEHDLETPIVKMAGKLKKS